MAICDNKVVTLNYTLTNDNDQILDQSQNGEFTYLHGANNIIPGLEKALNNKQLGDNFQVSISPEEGYGEHDSSLTQVVPLEMFESAEQVTVGQQFHAQSPDGEDILITVAAVDGDQVTIDGNHPLAGVQLNFDVTVVEIRDATAEEISHGHVGTH